MNKVNTVISLIAISLSLVACSTATTTIYPRENNQYQTVTLSMDEADGPKDAMKKATKICSEQGKQVVVVGKVETSYQGYDKNAVAAVDLGRSVLHAVNAANSSVSVGAGPNLHQTNDYKTVMNFTCQ